jgi:transglutaminase/protease-like cytokinesis protein 3
MRIRSFMTFMLIAIIILISQSSALAARSEIVNETYQLPLYNSSTPLKSTLSTTQVVPSAKINPARTALSEAIAKHLFEQETTFSLQITDYGLLKQLNAIFEDALKANDYVHYIVAAYGYSAKRTKTNEIKISFTITYLESKLQTGYVEKQVQLILGEIIKPDMNVYQKEKAIHDYIVSHIAYDTKLANYTAYAAIAKGKTVCQGFALLTYRMLEDVGIESRIEEGHAGGESHAWNAVNLEGKWFLLDTTWDDPIPFEKGRVLYNYYNVTDAQLQKDHTWIKSAYPAANTNFQNELQTKIVNDPDHAQVYEDLIKAFGLQTASAQPKVINKVHKQVIK